MSLVYALLCDRCGKLESATSVNETTQEQASKWQCAYAVQSENTEYEHLCNTCYRSFNDDDIQFLFSEEDVEDLP